MVREKKTQENTWTDRWDILLAGKDLQEKSLKTYMTKEKNRDGPTKNTGDGGDKKIHFKQLRTKKGQGELPEKKVLPERAGADRGPRDAVHT